MKTVIVIPARLASTRLPRKLLLRETGMTVLEHTYRAAAASQLADQVIVAADDREIINVVEGFGGTALMTDPKHSCGSDRVAEVAAATDCDLVVNVQGDEPEISPDAIDQVIAMLRPPEAKAATLATPIRDKALLFDPACVKVVCDHLGRALYFSRSPIPCPRHWDDELLHRDPGLFWQHLGIYGYRRDYLLELAASPAVELESVESLEQLRILYRGDTLLVGRTLHRSRGIDTPEDYQSFVRRWNC